MHPRPLSDEVLAAQVAQGDKTAFGTLYDRHASIVLGITFQIVRERGAAEEVLNEIFWRIWQGAVIYPPQHGPFVTWLLRTARDLAIENYRRRNSKTIMEAMTSNPILDVKSVSKMNELEQAPSNFIAQQTRDAVNTLSAEQRKVIELAYFQGMTRQEIAQATGESVDTIHIRAREGLQKLREELKKVGVEF